MAQRLIEDVALLSPHTHVRPHVPVTINDPWDFEEVYAAFLDFATHYEFDTENEEYQGAFYHHRHSRGTNLLVLLTGKRATLPASLLQTGPRHVVHQMRPSPLARLLPVIDPIWPLYATLTSRFQREQQQSVSFLKAGIDTHNATFNKLIDRIERSALRSTDPILLTGPTGAGKSFLAKRIFSYASRGIWWRENWWRLTARPCAAIMQCPRCSVT